MTKAKKRKCVVGYAVVALLALSFSSFFVATSYADCDLSKNGSKLDEFAQNNILFYCPGASNDLCMGASYSGQVTWADLDPLSDPQERFKKIVQAYGSLTQQLQKYYGVPWEMPLAMMISESYVGLQSDPGSPNMKAKEIGDYNLLSLVDANNTFYKNSAGEFVDPYADPNNPVQSESICDDEGHCDLEEGTPGSQKHVFKNFTSISSMIVDYVIYHVRSGTGGNGGYDAGLRMLTPNEYEENLQNAIVKIMSPFCVDASSGDCYSGNLYTYIRDYNSSYGKILKEVMDENGWMDSGELAKAWNIQPGGLATTEMKWGNDGWGDIRQEAWGAYGVLGLPEDVASKLGSNGTGCGTRLYGSCFKHESESDGGCTEDGSTFYLQGGSTWASEPYSGDCGTTTIGNAGCAPSAVAMVITALTNDYVTPAAVVKTIKEKIDNDGWRIQSTGFYDGGKWMCGGSNAGELYRIAEYYNVKAENIGESSSLSVESVNNLLDQGKVLVTSVGSYPVHWCNDSGCDNVGSITSGGHFIAIRGRSDDGRWLIFDSATASNNNNRYDPQDMINLFKSRSREVTAFSR